MRCLDITFSINRWFHYTKKHGIPPCFLCLFHLSSSHQYAQRSRRISLGSQRLVCLVLLDNFWFLVLASERSLEISCQPPQFFCHLANSFRRANSSSTLEGQRKWQVDFCTCDDAWHNKSGHFGICCNFQVFSGLWSVWWIDVVIEGRHRACFCRLLVLIKIVVVLAEHV